MAGRPHHGDVFVLGHSMAVEIFCYIVKDGGSTCCSVKHGGLFSFPCAFPDRFCLRDNMADLVMCMSWQFLTWTSWRVLLPCTFVAGFAPRWACRIVKDGGVCRACSVCREGGRGGLDSVGLPHDPPNQKGGRIKYSQLVADGIRLS